MIAMPLRRLLLALLPGALVALAVRLWALVELRGSFLFEPLLVDHAYYMSWAVRIARGDVVSDQAFEMDPGYAYLLGGLLALLGESLWVPRMLGLLQGITSTVLVGVLAAQLQSKKSPSDGGAPAPLELSTDDVNLVRISALVAALFPVTLFFDLLVMKTSTAVMLVLAVVVSVLAARRRPTATRILVAGLLFALSCTVRGNLLLLSPVLLLAVAGVARRQSLKQMVRLMCSTRNLFFVVGMAPVFSLTLAHNFAASGEVALLHGGGGEVFYLGTFAEGGGEYVKLPFVRAHPAFEHQDFRDEAARRLGHPVSRAEASRFWWRAGLQRIHDDPWSYLKLEVRKGLKLLSAFELPDSVSFYFFASLLTPLGLLGPFGVGVLVPFAFAGLALVWTDRRRQREPVALLPAIVGLGILASFLLFFVYGRFRAPGLLLLVPYAVLGVSEAWRRRREAGREVAVYLGVLISTAVVVNLGPAANPERELQMQYENYGSWYLDMGRPQLGRALLLRAVQSGSTGAWVPVIESAISSGDFELADQGLGELRQVRPAPADLERLEALRGQHLTTTPSP